MDRKKTFKGFYMLLCSTFLTSVWGILEHFGHSFSCFIFPDFKSFDVACWVQDVKTRVFASFGQPNWFAAWLCAVIPLTWAYGMLNVEYRISKKEIPNYILYSIFYILSLVFFVTLLFTKSRSGILAFCISFAIFWGSNLFSSRKTKDGLKKVFTSFFLTTSFLLLATILIGTPWTPNFKEFSINNFQFSKNAAFEPLPTTPAGPALEVGGGTESGIIRRIVWTGAIDIWKKYPIFGSGVETFAYSYYGSRPKAHNLVSEWDYLYNKAHNEYLNYAATTGTIGLLSYVFLIFSTIWLFYRGFQLSNNNSNSNSNLIIIGLTSGYITILITNFFGFSVVPVSFLFFLLPAFAITINEPGILNHESKLENLNNSQKFGIFLTFILASYSLIHIFRYWQTDYVYAKGKYESEAGVHQLAINTLSRLVKSSPNEPLYWDELADALSQEVVNNSENQDPNIIKELANSVLADGNRAITLSPSNVNFKRKQASRLISMSALDQNYLISAINILEQAVVQAPTDAKLFYNLALAYLRTGDYEKAVKVMKTTVELKPDYERAHYALALMYEDTKETSKAKAELEYILKNINPKNSEAQRELEELK